MWKREPYRTISKHSKMAGWWHVYRGGMHTGNPQPSCLLESEEQAIVVCKALNDLEGIDVK